MSGCLWQRHLGKPHTTWKIPYSDVSDPDFSLPKDSKSSLRQGTSYHYAVIKYFYFTIPFPLLASVTLPCAGHYWVDMSMAHLKISSVLCSNTRFVFPLRSSSCKAPGSASGIRISVNSLQLRSTNCSSNKQHDKICCVMSSVTPVLLTNIIQPCYLF